MNELHYAYANARIRANETKMITSADLPSLISSKTFEETLNFLVKKNWCKAEDSEIKEIINHQNENVWTLLNESVPDKQSLKILTASNDFFNLKTAIKCHFSDLLPFDYYVYPTSIDLELLTSKVKNHEFDFLGGKMSEALIEAYDVVSKTQNGQNAEAIIDKMAIEFIQESAKKTECKLTKEISNLLCAIANIKIAIRCAKTQKKRDFIEMSIGSCEGIDTKRLIEASALGESEVMAYLSSTRYAKATQKLTESATAFEKWCDDEIIKVAKSAKYTCFGFAPVCAYFYAKQIEIKTVRMILIAKQSGITENEIKERVRTLYA